MNVPTLDWCVKHGHPRYYTENFCWWGRPPCDIVTRRLVPVDALVLVRDADTLPMLYSYHDEWTPYVNTTLEAQVAEAIRRYPNGDAPGWLAPIAAIKVVEKWLLDALAEAVKDPQ